MLTRYVLIDLFLRLLGWDIEDLRLVRPAFSTQADRPDHALLDGNSRTLAFIGAKSLGKQGIRTNVSRTALKYFVATDGAKVGGV